MPRNGAYYLSEFIGRKVRIKCDCGLVRQYDGAALFEKIGEQNMVGLRLELARRNGCAKTEERVYNCCRVHYEF